MGSEMCIRDSLGYDLVWFGVIMVKFLEIGLITPPVGLNVYILKGVVGDAVPLETIFKGIMWFLAMDILTLAMLITFPEISLWLPTLLLRSYANHDGAHWLFSHFVPLNQPVKGSVPCDSRGFKYPGTD